jgi:response regulator RpfG family c-di-GMP phosphodiesterase
VTSISTILVLQPKESWKLEEFDHMKVNYELGAKLVNFLKKMGLLSKVYKIILSRDKPLSVSDLRQEGVVVNQK